MKAKELLAALDLPFSIARAAPPSMQLCQHVRISGGKAFATNGATAVEVDTPGVELAACVPGPRLAAVLEAAAALAPEAEVKLSASATRLTVSAPHMRHSMPIIAADQMPEPGWPQDEQPLANWAGFVDAIGYVERAAARKDIRTFLTGVASLGGAIVASDGSRAHVARGESPLPDGPIIPIDAVATLLELPACEAIAASETAIAVRFKGGRFMARLLAAKYPDLLRMVPESHADNAVTLERAALERAIAAMRKTRLTPAVKLSVERDTVILEDASADGDTRIELPVAWQGTPWSFGLNSQYLLDAVSHADGDHLVMSWPGERTKPMHFTGSRPSRAAVVMQFQI